MPGHLSHSNNNNTKIAKSVLARGKVIIKNRRTCSKNKLTQTSLVLYEPIRIQWNSLRTYIPLPSNNIQLHSKPNDNINIFASERFLLEEK